MASRPEFDGDGASAWMNGVGACTGAERERKGEAGLVLGFYRGGREGEGVSAGKVETINGHGVPAVLMEIRGRERSN
jgi:hypothetical protein